MVDTNRQIKEKITKVQNRVRSTIFPGNSFSKHRCIPTLNFPLMVDTRCTSLLGSFLFFFFVLSFCLNVMTRSRWNQSYEYLTLQPSRLMYVHYVSCLSPWSYTHGIRRHSCTTGPFCRNVYRFWSLTNRDFPFTFLTTSRLVRTWNRYVNGSRYNCYSLILLLKWKVIL